MVSRGMKLNSQLARAGLTARVMAVSMATKSTRGTDGTESGCAEAVVCIHSRALPGGIAEMVSETSRLATMKWMAIFFSTVTAAIAASAQEKPVRAVDEVFADLSQPGSPGCALAVARDSKIIYEQGYGLANIEEGVVISPQTVFDIGSTSKQFTAASILLLEKQGKLSVNDDIRKYLPEIPDYGHKITILHLLNHTSGLRDYLTLFILGGVNIDNVTTDEDALAVVARQKALNFVPGSEWLYSNTGFFLLSVIVKRSSGKTLREFATENIFEPLDMKHTVF